ncbi:MAG TPA: PBP1A family penicillin-binding protein [Gemmatimonadales bacterium]|nr:PBP1A family penicillin-binding protein [Gemmatimonadales bacterium]
MTRQAMIQRCREALLSLRARVPLRLVVRSTLALTLLGTVAIGTEAVFRARLVAPAARVPTALYTRPVPWGGNGERRAPISIGNVGDGAAERRVPVALADLPDHLIQAVLAVEDQRFYQHHGLDIRRIAGAMVANIKAGGIAQGGSTITQQLAKNLFLSASRTPLRKLREAALALVLEIRYAKPVILEAYLNEIYLGQDADRGIHGVGAAARYYFGKPAARITLAESALLAGMISAPNRYMPTRNPESARQRRELVLKLLVDQQRVSRTVAERAGRAGLPVRTYRAAGVDGRYFRDFALAAIGSRPPARGVAVYTTLDATLQRAAERAVGSGLDRLAMGGAEAGLVAIDPRTGEVLAMVGGRDYGASQFNRATEARRQPGSAFKPVVALAALERWEGRDPAFTLASVVDDEPLRVSTPQGPWEPGNYDGEFRGRVTVREAMEQSLNVPFARIGLAIGPDRIVAAARRLGITSPLHPVPSLALGSSEVTLMELVRAYGVLAAGGNLAAPRAVLGRARYGDRVGGEAAAEPARVIDPAVAYLVTSTLEGVVSRGTGRALNQDGRFGSIAGKTGTSNDWRDAWFIAYSPSLVVGAWVGFDDGRSLRLTGAGAALPIVARFLAEATSETEGGTFEVPEGISEGYTTIADAGWDAECGSREYFLTGTEPAGGDCGMEPPEWGRSRGWISQFQRQAVRLLQDLLSEQRERRHSQR